MEVDVHAVLLAAEAMAERSGGTAVPPVVVGLVAFGSLLGLLLLTYAFRSVGTRH